MSRKFEQRIMLLKEEITSIFIKRHPSTSQSSSISFYSQVAAFHLRRLVDAHQAEDGGSDVLQGAVGAQAQVGVVAHEDERHRVSGVIGVGRAVLVDHGFGVAVVGGNNPGAAL